MRLRPQDQEAFIPVVCKWRDRSMLRGLLLLCTEVGYGKRLPTAGQQIRRKIIRGTTE